jgi:hypothetical protein
MRIFDCPSDIGSVLVGNEDFGIALPNIGGDGWTVLRIYENRKEKDADCKARGVELRFITSIEGKFNIYNYDCSDRKPEDIIATIEGRYGVYSGQMEVALEKWS